MDDTTILTEVRLPVLWGASLRLFSDGTVTLSTSEDEATLTDDNLAQAADLIARAQQIRNGGQR
jgi:hypothetical protein